MAASVVVVESPAKAKTIERYLGPGFTVLASYGHVRDLPAKDGSVLPDQDFAMTYVLDDRGAKHIAAIAQAVKGAGNLFLATDPDREGEAISWHVAQALDERRALEGVSVKRVAFHEITKSAVQKAMANPRDLDMNLINAQQARRALDYLVGFTLSPVLWRKLPGSRSAGRVQSVALRLVCERETGIEAFKPREYWTIETDFKTPEGKPFTARLTHLDGNKLGKYDLPNEATATAAAAAIAAREFTVTQVEAKQTKRNPAPPFTTSTLQQEAARKLGFTTKRTMQVAQRLYEGTNLDGEIVGLITYMRTDSVNLAGEAVAACRQMIGDSFGAAYLPDAPRAYRSSAKNAQEAHEAIRPTGFGRRPEAMARYIEDDQRRLYELIWKRAVASQMENALIDRVAVDIAAADGGAILRASGSRIAFDGFLRLYREGRDDGARDDDGDRMLPALAANDALDRSEVRPDQHFTEPPPRFTEATLVKRLEELGIGRPSTYASILSVLQERDYVRLDKKRFYPENRGRLVTAFLESFFKRYVEYDFTSELEDRLDDIANGKIEWKLVLREFWTAFIAKVDDTKELRVSDVLDALDGILGPHIFADDGSGKDRRKCPSCDGGRLNLKLGKFGAFVGCANYPDCRYTRPFDGGGEAGGVGNESLELGVDPNSGLMITVRKGPYGNYVQLGEQSDEGKPKRVSLPKPMTPADLDLAIAIGLLSLPRDIGSHPETGEMIIAGIGRFGPYLKHGKAFVSLKADDVLSVGLNRATALLAEGKRGGRKTVEPLREIGAHPRDGEMVKVMDGRYGPYLNYNGLNAPLPKTTTPEAITMDEAVAQLDERGKAPKGRRRAAAKKKPAAKKKAAPRKKPAAKKKPATAGE